MQEKTTTFNRFIVIILFDLLNNLIKNYSVFLPSLLYFFI